MDNPPSTPKYTRHDGWTGERRRDFIEALAKVGNVRDACRQIGLSGQAAYDLRARDPVFTTQWDSALSARRAADLEARTDQDTRSPLRRRAPSPLRHLRELDKLAGLTW